MDEQEVVFHPPEGVEGEPYRLTLSRCPFCGSNYVELEFDTSVYYIRCANCRAQGPMYTTPQIAAEEWNTRP